MTMKISDIAQQIKPESKVQVDNNRGSRKADQKSDGRPVGVDTVELSAASREVQKIQAILADTPAVRAELVQALKEQIDKGEYQVDSRKLAEKMIMTLLTEELGK